MPLALALALILLGACGATTDQPAVVCPRNALDKADPSICIFTTLDCPDGNRYAAGCSTDGSGKCVCARNGMSTLTSFNSTTWCTDSAAVQLKALRDSCGFPL